MAATTIDYPLNEEAYVALLDKLIGESRHVQNNPPKFVPKEDLTNGHVLARLAPFTKAEGGVLDVRRISYVEGRGNVVVTYASANADAPTVGFVGSHLDVVPADPATWKRDPFKLVREGDYLYGRGTTDCLGHVALLTELFVELATHKPALDVTVAAVFIASEESSAIPDVGVDMLVKKGELDFLKRGPVYWVDSADSQPCIGTAGALMWRLKVSGKLFHSGLPYKAINPIELGNEALRVMQDRFYADFAATDDERRYNYAAPSTFKPTQVAAAEGSLNQIPPSCTYAGDARITPFHDMQKVMDALQRYVAEINADPSKLSTRGSVSKYTLPDEDKKGVLELTFEGNPLEFRGIACNIDSPGYVALADATKDVLGEVKPYAIGGSLPLVKELQEAGLDIHICGYGISSVYHGDNEYCLLSDMVKASKIFCGIINRLNATAAAAKKAGDAGAKSNDDEKK